MKWLSAVARVASSRGVTLLGRHAGLPDRAREPRDQRCPDQRRRDHRGAVASDELAHDIRRARRRGHHRLAREEALQVLRERVGGLVAAIGLLFHRLHDDPVELAAQQRDDLEPAGSSDVPPAPARCRQRRAARWGSAGRPRESSATARPASRCGRTRRHRTASSRSAARRAARRASRRRCAYRCRCAPSLCSGLM